MDLVDLLQNPAYRHVLLNHIPVIGLIVAFIVLLAGLIIRQAALVLTGLVLIALTASVSLPVANYGDAAYPAIYDQLDGAGRGWLDYHAELADTWLPLLYANAAVAIAALLLVAVRRSTMYWAALIAAVVTLGGIGSAVVIANAGGKIQHPEFRISAPPAINSVASAAGLRGNQCTHCNLLYCST